MNAFLEAIWSRRVVQVGVLYLGVAWVLLQVADQIEETLELPGWVDQAVLVLLGLGLPIVLIAAWAGSSGRAPVSAGEAIEAAPERDVPGSETTPAVVTDRPSIAVLPFANLSQDAEQAFLADGMTEDIITGLSCNRHLFVIARNSSFVYKDRAVDVRTVGRELGVRYVLEGSIRRIGNRVRTTAQLIEAETGAHLWAEKYDVPYAEIFELQDEVIGSITAALGAQLADAEAERARSAKPSDLGAWEWCQRAISMVPRSSPSSEVLAEAIGYLERALEIDPDYAYAHGALAWFRFSSVVNGWSGDPARDFEEGRRQLARAQQLAGEDPLSLYYVGAAQIYAGEFRKGVATLERALERNPNSSDALVHLGLGYAYLGDFDRAHAAIDRAERLSPTGGWAFAHEWYRGLVLVMEGRFEDALPYVEGHVQRAPSYGSALLVQAICLDATGRTEEARAAVARAVEVTPTLRRDRIPAAVLSSPDPEQGRRVLLRLKALWPEDPA